MPDTTPIQSQATEPTRTSGRKRGDWDAQVPRGDESGIPHPQGDVNRAGNQTPKVPAQGLYSRRHPSASTITGE